MTRTFDPCMNVLPPAPQRLWPQVRPSVGLGFVLYGGTAVGLRLGHRPSVDFDFFSDVPLVAAMIRAGVSLAHGLASARLLFGPNFQPSESLKALACFDDGDLASLTPADKKTLVDATKAVRDLPDVTLVSKRLSGARG